MNTPVMPTVNQPAVPAASGSIQSLSAVVASRRPGQPQKGYRHKSPRLTLPPSHSSPATTATGRHLPAATDSPTCSNVSALGKQERHRQQANTLTPDSSIGKQQARTTPKELPHLLEPLPLPHQCRIKDSVSTAIGTTTAHPEQSLPPKYHTV